jgi:DNA polymerase II large subunit
VYKSLKDTKLKITPTCFGSYVIHHQGVQSWEAGRTVYTPQVQNYAAKHQPSTRQNICETLRVISVKHSSVFPDDGSHEIRNMSE